MRYLTAVGLSQVLVPSSAFSLCFLLDLTSCFVSRRCPAILPSTILDRAKSRVTA